ncbi:MAG: hypothetical protein IPN53_08790 [Comamonadaceae bacterium]|nr:hypothetical protein [Comamonadaceae bacterium]
METKICAACGIAFTPRHQKPRQKYCSAPNCQSKRRQVWQKERLQDNQFHQENQADAQQDWLDRNPGYWKKYRSEHPEYVEQNRKKQRNRDSKAKFENLAKSDVSIQPHTLKSRSLFSAASENSWSCKERRMGR